MSSPPPSGTVAYWNGRLVPAEGLSISVFDTGFIQGVTVAEQLRTFGGQLFRLPQHLDRLQHSLSIIGVDPGLTPEQLGTIAEDLVRRNHPVLPEGDDLGVALWVTPGPYPKFAGAAPPGPVVCCHTHPLDFDSWADKYESGERLITSRHRQVSPQSWPAELKCRSRMHYYLADLEARATDPAARGLLLDLDGFVCEASTANVLACLEGEGIVAPCLRKILPGISMSVLKDLASQLGIPFGNRDIGREEFAAANEILLCSTSPCVLPVVALDGRPVATGRPGPIFRRLLEAWSERVGFDIAAQARQFARR